MLTDSEIRKVNRDFGIVINKKRNELKLTQAELADQIGITRVSVANLEAGKYNSVSSAVMQVAAVLGLSLDNIIADLKHSPGLEGKKIYSKAELMQGAVTDILKDLLKPECFK